MMQPGISIAGSSAPFVVLQSSAGRLSDGIVVERRRYEPGEVDASFRDHHVFCTNLGPAATIETDGGGGSARPATVMPGDVFFWPQDVAFRHSLKRTMEVLDAGLTPAFVADVARQIGGSAAELHPFHGMPDPQIRHLMGALEAGLEEGAAADRLYQESVAVALCVHLLRRNGVAGSAPASSFTPGSSRGRAFGRARDYIHAHLDADLSLAEIANAAAMSPYHFSRAFKTSTGLSPHQYVLRARVEAAKDLLVAGKLSLAEIAFRVGFYDQSHLARHFKRCYGVPPRKLVDHSKLVAH